jgi:ABC-type transport system involved in multi-copper enzyme maturation permease subunit
MNNALRIRQTWTIARLQLSRVFFSRRSFWVYLLALFPSVIFLGHGIFMKVEHRFMSSEITPAAILESISRGMEEGEVIKKAGKPLKDGRFNRGPRQQHIRTMVYFDGERQWNLFFREGVLQTKQSRQLFNFNEDRTVFATMFQTYYLRLAVFFGCLGIFMNLFRSEMLDKTLHFWFLTPARREVLLAGKYLAGIVAAVSIFSIGAILSFAIMLWPYHGAQLTVFWQGPGVSHFFSYASAAALACVGYGSVFLAFGLVLRNPVIPAIVMLFWENVNGILPALLQKMSILYYAQSLCPVPIPVDDITPPLPPLMRLLMSPAEPPSVTTAVFGFIIVTALVLWIASRVVRRLEINYSTD